jgi:N6-adenosine-specific RNA methylase IME4
MKKYNVILADPPWSYNDKGSLKHPGASHKYECMSLEDIQSLPIKDTIPADDCVLFMWTTMPFLPDAIETVKKWGFTFKTVGFVWVKRNKKKKDGWFYGMGNWTRANAELVIIATRGNPKRVSAAVHSVIEAPVRGHSQKPDEIYERIERLCGDVPRIELFARQRREGWDSVGLAIDGIKIESFTYGRLAGLCKGA